jgi:hypothetical protein
MDNISQNSDRTVAGDENCFFPTQSATMESDEVNILSWVKEPEGYRYENCDRFCECERWDNLAYCSFFPIPEFPLTIEQA